jgi:hypothetical protein
LARETFASMSKTGKSNASTQYLMYKVALADGDEELGTKVALDSEPRIERWTQVFNASRIFVVQTMVRMGINTYSVASSRHSSLAINTKPHWF